MPPSRRAVVRGLGLATLAGVGVGTLAELGDGSRSPTASALVAGSLLELAARLPGAEVEAHGSVAVRRLVLDGLREPDAVALADPRLFDGLADEVTLFATNALVLAYDPTSPHADAVADDWRSALGTPAVAIGRTDPLQDPLGYRTVMALRLAERAYGVDADAVLDRAARFPETDLANALEGGAIDAAFTYRNMAVQRDLPYADLPDPVDFSDPSLAETYAEVAFDLGDRRVRGTPIRYAATALTDRGEPWVERLVTARARLEAAGFGVPADYPRRDRSVPGARTTTRAARAGGRR